MFVRIVNKVFNCIKSRFNFNAEHQRDQKTH
jgi:hypothetical protein